MRLPLLTASARPPQTLDAPLAEPSAIAWKEAAIVLALSRLAILLISFIGAYTLQLPAAALSGANVHLLIWYHYDAIAYVRIAQQSYSILSDTAFFPLWPLLLHLTAAPFGGGTLVTYFAGLLIANVCFFFALVLLYRLVSAEFGLAAARAVLFYLAFNPFAVFFFLGYTESFFLLLALGVFLLLRRAGPLNWWLAGGLGLLAALTRSTAIILLVPFFVLALRPEGTTDAPGRPTWRRALAVLAPAALIPLGFLVYALYLGHLTGNPFVFSAQENAQWHRQLSFPLIGVISAARGALAGSISNILDLAYLGAALLILVLGWRFLPLRYSLFAAAGVLFCLGFPLYEFEPLASLPRYLMLFFPIILICALWSQRPRFDRLYTAISLPLFALNIVLFTHHYLIA